MSSPLRLVVGLGNPGTRYDSTRHNAGFWLVDALAKRYRLSFKKSSRFFGELAEGNVDGETLRLLKPTTFMNESGRSVGAVASFYRLAAEEIMIAHDEIDLGVGTVRLKRGGGHGGHNGLRDIVPQLGSADFLRVRIGVGHPGESAQVVNYVLKPPSAAERTQIIDAIERVLEHAPQILRGEYQRAMNVIHRKTGANEPGQADEQRTRASKESH